MDDQRLLALFLARDVRAIEQAKQQYGRLLQQLCRNILEDGRDAEECVNDALLFTQWAADSDVVTVFQNPTGEYSQQSGVVVWDGVDVTCRILLQEGQHEDYELWWSDGYYDYNISYHGSQPPMSFS